MRSNHDFCVEWVRHQAGTPRVLDYGCGAGEIVLALRSLAVESFGCDVFYEGGDRSCQVAPELFDGGVIRRMTPGSIPFEDGSFDLVVNNQVLEHVEGLEDSLAEISRVLKPGGKLLSLFPHREVWFEGHVGLPFVHWFSRSSRIRLPYATLMRLAGFGFSKKGKSISTWSRHSLDYLDRWTHYRSRVEIDRAFSRHFTHPLRREAEWLNYKLEDVPAARMLPPALMQWVTTTVAGMVFECEKLRVSGSAGR